MVRHLIVQAIISVGKSVFQAYKNVSKGQPSQAASNPYSEWLKKSMQATNMIQTPMTIEEAYKILNISEILKEEKEQTDQIMKSYVRLFNKNNVSLGGSAYIQSKIYNSKEFLLANKSQLEKQWYIDNKIDPESLQSTEETQKADNSTAKTKDTFDEQQKQ